MSKAVSATPDAPMKTQPDDQDDRVAKEAEDKAARELDGADGSPEGLVHGIAGEQFVVKPPLGN